MPKNITYLLGAGASANSIPIMSKITDRLKIFQRYLYEAYNEDENWKPVGGIPKEIFEYGKKTCEKLHDEIGNLIDESGKHLTIDTLAKKYYLQDKEQLKALKSIVIALFIFEQSEIGLDYITSEWKNNAIDEIKQLPDKRYDTFVASIIGDEVKNFDLPPNIKILTWNYDMQFELAYREYLRGSGIHVHDKAQIFPTFKTIDSKYIYKADKFSIVRLNGVAGQKTEFAKGESNIVTYLDRPYKGKEGLLSFISYYSDIREGRGQLPAYDFLIYNWETHPKNTNRIFPNAITIREIAKNIMSQTDILVIIGYSFPMFNRRYDLELIKNIDVTKCKRVYIQDINAENIAETLSTMRPDAFVGILPRPAAVEILSDTFATQFFLPDEIFS